MDPIGNIYRLLFDCPREVILGSEQPTIRALRSAYELRKNAQRYLAATIPEFCRAKDEYAAIYRCVASHIAPRGREHQRIDLLREEFQAPDLADALILLDRHFNADHSFVEYFQHVPPQQAKRELAVYLAGQSHHFFGTPSGEGLGYLRAVPQVIDAFHYGDPGQCFSSATDMVYTHLIDLSLSDIFNGTFSPREIQDRWVRMLFGC